jgi:hypothetical protein
MIPQTARDWVAAAFFIGVTALYIAVELFRTNRK